MNLAPIVLFVYNRPWHTLQTLESLMRNELADSSQLFIYSDGPKGGSLEDAQKVEEVRKILRSQQWCKEVHVVESKVNKGLASSIIAGISEIINQYGTIIVLEDDMVSSQYFLQFMNDALGAYENNDSIISITGYIYPIENLPKLFFLKGADCWGWATWKRGWALFEQDGKQLLQQLKNNDLTYTFDLNGSYPYTQMLENQTIKKNDSWAIRWHASAFLSNKLTLFPGRSLIRNIGLDSSGTHCGNSIELGTEPSTIQLKLEWIDVEHNNYVVDKIAQFFNNDIQRKSIFSLYKMNLLAKFRNLIR